MTVESSPIRDRQSALAFLFGRIDYERTRTVPYSSRRFKLERMWQLAELLGHPEHDFPAIHVAGTKGKGSTATMIAASLTAAGMRTGLYTSPHLHRLEERFVVDGQQCSEAELVALLTDIQCAVDELDAAAAGDDSLQGPTYFEITTAAALLHFRRKQVQCAVLEVGLGGRLDSTNICRPAVSVVTTISLDHTRQLGKTLAKIAGEKAGIIKPSIPVVTGVCQQEPFEVIQAVADQHAAPLLAAGRDFDFEYVGSPCDAAGVVEPNGGNALDYHEQINGVSRTLSRVKIGMLGRHQAANAAVALATLGQLQRMGWAIDDAAIRVGLEHARCPARFEVVGREPAIIFDAAHNPASMTALNAALTEQFPDRPRLLVFAASVDKNVRQMLEQLLPNFEGMVVTRYANNPRAMDPVAIEKLAADLARKKGWSGLQVDVCPDSAAAWQRIRARATPAHVICVTGSFFLVAEIKDYLEAVDQEAAGASSLLR